MKPIRQRYKELINILYGNPNGNPNSTYGNLGNNTYTFEMNINVLNEINNILNKEYFDNNPTIDITKLNIKQIERIYDLYCINKKCKNILN